MRRQARGYMQGFETAASAATVWRALIEPEALRSWYATEAIVEPRAGGRYATVSRLFGRREAHIERFDAGARLQLIYEPSPDWPPLSDSALVEDFIIDERKGKRMLRVMGSGIPADEEWAKTLVRLRTAWALAFAQLQMKLREGSIGEPAA
ncbi:MAG: SRPBCC domain-containing protein [Steroidobacteraceae bacterium]